jgi:hypothetical protein
MSEEATTDRSGTGACRLTLPRCLAVDDLLLLSGLRLLPPQRMRVSRGRIAGM